MNTSLPLLLPMRRNGIALVFLAALASPARAADAPGVREPAASTGNDAPLDAVVVSASRTEQRIMDTAASIDVIGRQQIQDGQAAFNLSEPLARAPGLVALNRQNYAQDLLISSRGFGANSTFGARGLRIYVDGIPGTMADGQGQISHIDLPSAERVEVLRGPFSVLYGNSAGGVVSVFTESGRPGLHATPYFSAGSFGQMKGGLKVDGADATRDFVIDAGTLRTQGYREHGSADRQNANAKLGLRLGEDTTLGVIANNVSLSALDPLGLTASQLAFDRHAAGTGAITYNTRKTVNQTQGGLVFTHRVSADDSFTIAPYLGDRQTMQYLATATNGVLRLQRNYYGLNSAWNHRGEIAAMPLTLVAGIEGGGNDDHRLGYASTAGNQTGPATQDYSMLARNLDGFAQGSLRASDAVAFTAGLRASRTALESQSNLTPAQSPGGHAYRALTGMGSVQYDLREQTSVYASYGTGFDTPTLNQVFYSPAYVANPSNPNTGNIGLQAASTRQVEIGLKSALGRSGRVTLAIFDAATTNEVVVDSSVSGKTAFGNAPATHRKGVELSLVAPLSVEVQASVALAAIDARVTQTYQGYSGTTVVSGNRIPGVPGQTAFAELMWRRPDRALEVAAETRAAATIAANDVNGAWSGGYGVVALRAVARQRVARWDISEFARVDNLFDRAYVGSVIVNQASSQFYESAPGRNWLVGVRASYNFE